MVQGRTPVARCGPRTRGNAGRPPCIDMGERREERNLKQRCRLKWPRRPSAGAGTVGEALQVRVGCWLGFRSLPFAASALTSFGCWQRRRARAGPQLQVNGETSDTPNTFTLHTNPHPHLPPYAHPSPAKRVTPSRALIQPLPPVRASADPQFVRLCVACALVQAYRSMR